MLTVPAVNAGAAGPEAVASGAVRESMLHRMDLMLALALSVQAKILVLGAWGCGVFRNPPEEMAQMFRSFLVREEGEAGVTGKYAGCFDRVLFPVYDASKGQPCLVAFQQVLSEGRR